MIRTQIQLTEEQIEKLKIYAAGQQVSVSEAVRQAVDILLRVASAPSPSELKKRALSAAGRFASGQSDIARRHDDYLAETLGR